MCTIKSRYFFVLKLYCLDKIAKKNSDEEKVLGNIIKYIDLEAIIYEKYPKVIYLIIEFVFDNLINVIKNWIIFF